jgi:hypothetical protein
METRPFDAPRKGMIVFSKDAGLMATITKVSGNAFNFEVHNGAWSGTFRDGNIHIHGDGHDIHPCRGVDEVLRVTADEVDQWYLRGVRGVSSLLAGEPVSGASRLEQAVAEKELDEVDLGERALAFIEARDLSAAFADHLLELPDAEIDDRAFDDDIAF